MYVMLIVALASMQYVIVSSVILTNVVAPKHWLDSPLTFVFGFLTQRSIEIVGTININYLYEDSTICVKLHLHVRFKCAT